MLQPFSCINVVFVFAFLHDNYKKNWAFDVHRKLDSVDSAIISYEIAAIIRC